MDFVQQMFQTYDDRRLALAKQKREELLAQQAQAELERYNQMTPDALRQAAGIADQSQYRGLQEQETYNQAQRMNPMLIDQQQEINNHAQLTNPYLRQQEEYKANQEAAKARGQSALATNQELESSYQKQILPDRIDAFENKQAHTVLNNSYLRDYSQQKARKMTADAADSEMTQRSSAAEARTAEQEADLQSQATLGELAGRLMDQPPQERLQALQQFMPKYAKTTPILGEIAEVGGFAPEDVSDETLQTLKKRGEQAAAIIHGKNEKQFEQDLIKSAREARTEQAAKALGKAEGEKMQGSQTHLATVNSTIKNLNAIMGSGTDPESEDYTPPMAGFYEATGLPVIHRKPFSRSFGDANKFQAKMRQIQGQQFVAIYEALKGAGQVTDSETRRALNSLGAIDLDDAPETVMDQLGQLRMHLVQAREKLKGLNKGQNQLETGTYGRPSQGVKRIRLKPIGS